MKWLNDILSKARARRENQLFPERQFNVTVNETSVVLSHPEQQSQSIARDDLVEVCIAATDEGPWICDWFWVLRTDGGGLVIPRGASGELGLLERLQRLPNFDNGAVLQPRPRNRDFQVTCWKRE